MEQREFKNDSFLISDSTDTTTTTILTATGAGSLWTSTKTKNNSTISKSHSQPTTGKNNVNYISEEGWS